MILKRLHEGEKDHTQQTSRGTNFGSKDSKIEKGKLLKQNEEAEVEKETEGSPRLSSKTHKGNGGHLLQNHSKAPQKNRDDDDKNIENDGSILTSKGKDASENVSPPFNRSQGGQHVSFSRLRKLHAQSYKEVTTTSKNNQDRTIEGLFTQEYQQLIRRPSGIDTFNDVIDEQSMTTKPRGAARKIVSRSTIAIHRTTNDMDDDEGHASQTSSVKRERSSGKRLKQGGTPPATQRTRYNVEGGKDYFSFYLRSKEENLGARSSRSTIQKEGNFESNGDLSTTQRAAKQGEDAENADIRTLEAALKAQEFGAASRAKLGALQHQVDGVLAENGGCEAVRQTPSEGRMNNVIFSQESSSQNQQRKNIRPIYSLHGCTKLKHGTSQGEEKIFEQSLGNSSPASISNNLGSGKIYVIEDVRGFGGHGEIIEERLRTPISTRRTETAEIGQVVATLGSGNIAESLSTFRTKGDKSNLEGEAVSNFQTAVKSKSNSVETGRVKNPINQLKVPAMNHMEIKGQQENKEYGIQLVTPMPLSLSSDFNKGERMFPRDVVLKLNHHLTDNSVENIEDGKMRADVQMESRAFRQLQSISHQQQLESSFENGDVTTNQKAVKVRGGDRRFPARTSSIFRSEYQSEDGGGGATVRLASGNRGMEPHGSVLHVKEKECDRLGGIQNVINSGRALNVRTVNKRQKDFSSKPYYDPSVPLRFTTPTSEDPDEIHGNRDKNADTSGEMKLKGWKGEVEVLQIKNKRSLFGIMSKSSESVETATSNPTDSHSSVAVRVKGVRRDNNNEDEGLYPDSDTKSESISKNKHSKFGNSITVSSEGNPKIQFSNTEGTSSFSLDETSQLFSKKSSIMVQDSTKIPYLDIKNQENNSGKSISVEDSSECGAVVDPGEFLQESGEVRATSASNSHRGKGKKASYTSSGSGYFSTRHESHKKHSCKKGKRRHKGSSCHVTVILELPKQFADVMVPTRGFSANLSAERKDKLKGVLHDEDPSLRGKEKPTCEHTTHHKVQEHQVPEGDGADDEEEEDGFRVARRQERALVISGTNQGSGSRKKISPRPGAPASGPCELLSGLERVRGVLDAEDGRTKQPHHHEREDEDMENAPEPTDRRWPDGALAPVPALAPTSAQQGNRSFLAGALAKALGLPKDRARAAASKHQHSRPPPTMLPAAASAPPRHPGATPTPLFACTSRMLNS